MSVLRSDEFLADLGLQFDWYEEKAGAEVADRYLKAVETTAKLLGGHPELGPRGNFKHPRLHGWRFFVVARPFNDHVLFYEQVGDDIILRRTMRGQRDVPRRLLDPPDTD